jgi:hypothetical protein
MFTAKTLRRGFLPFCFGGITAKIKPIAAHWREYAVAGRLNSLNPTFF